jgi:integration host factor subunit beta
MGQASRANSPEVQKVSNNNIMTRSDLVAMLAEQFPQLTHRDAELAVKAILDSMSGALAKGHRIEIRGFGSFAVTRRPPRVGRNPRSGEQVSIPEKRVPHFKPGKALRESIHKSSAPLVNGNGAQHGDHDNGGHGRNGGNGDDD